MGPISRSMSIQWQDRKCTPAGAFSKVSFLLSLTLLFGELLSSSVLPDSLEPSKLWWEQR